MSEKDMQSVADDNAVHFTKKGILQSLEKVHTSDF